MRALPPLLSFSPTAKAAGIIAQPGWVLEPQWVSSVSSALARIPFTKAAVLPGKTRFSPTIHRDVEIFQQRQPASLGNPRSCRKLAFNWAAGFVGERYAGRARNA